MKVDQPAFLLRRYLLSAWDAEGFSLCLILSGSAFRSTAEGLCCDFLRLDE
jgi:hypothetical protein